MPISIFINYRRSDVPGTAAHLAGRLRREFGTANVFHDVTDIRAGQEWPRRLQKKIEESDVMLVLIGRHWADDANLDRLNDLDSDDWTREEILQAFRAGLSVVPVLVDDAETPQSDQLPRGIKRLPRRHAHLLRHTSFEADLAALVKALRRLPQIDKDGGPQPGTIATHPRDGLEYVWIPAGSFEMGAVDGDNNASSDESPRRGIELTAGFWMARTEVTVAAYEEYRADTGSSRPDPWIGNRGWGWGDHPIVRVTWDDAAHYCAWAQGRLPTEAEWEYAARGGVSGRRYPYDRAQMNYHDAKYRALLKNAYKYKYTQPVDWSRPNGYNLYDMAGNVWEWVLDWYDPNEYRRRKSKRSRTDPLGPELPTGQRVARGGSWDDTLSKVRVSNRLPLDPEESRTTVGFRCLLERWPS